ncbi:type II secretion system F family protein [Brachybacterium sp. YJGR34]|uniref:type II secretion system F family protein n=1 Tax=Brachybacterium sp. YJGR34 TaxID=2059911 RepID=UPI000E0AB697|nr:type II secretion system F family protein [Brachybacterium sp. YJGR34]
MSLALLPLALLLAWVLAPPMRRPALARPDRPARRTATGPLELARLVEELATVIGSGAGIRRAWGAVAGTLPDGELRDLARAGAAGADPRRAATGSLQGTAGIDALGAVLAVCERTGAPTAGMLQNLAEALRDLHDAAQARRSAFAGPRSTARILLVLPLAGIGLGALLGGDPLHLLTSSGVGRHLAIAGGALTVLGWWWMRRLVRRADPPAGRGVDPSLLLELIAGALESGLPLGPSVGAVAEALPPGPEATRLARLAGALAAGMPAALAARELPGPLETLGRSAVLAERSGADLAGVLRTAARDARRGRARESEVLAAQLGVRLVLPTGLALLPAFVVLGIIPTVISLLGGTFALGAPPP